MISLLTLGILLFEGSNRPSHQYGICVLYKLDEFLRWESWGTEVEEVTCPVFPPESSAAVLEKELSGSVSWSTAQSTMLLQFTEEELCVGAVASHAVSVFADSLCFLLPALNFLLDFRCFLFCCTARHFSTWRTLYFPFFFLPLPPFFHVTNYSDFILIYQIYSQYHIGVLKALPEQRCTFVWVSDKCRITQKGKTALEDQITGSNSISGICAFWNVICGAYYFMYFWCLGCYKLLSPEDPWRVTCWEHQKLLRVYPGLLLLPSSLS